MSLSPKQIAEFIRREARRTHYYKTLTTRNFRRYPNYSDYKVIMADIATYLLTADAGVPIKQKEGYDPAYISMLHSAYMMWKNPHFPVYAIKDDLAHAFLNTDMPSHVCETKKMFDIALFLLPNNLIKNPDDLSCTYLLVTQMEPKDIARYNQGYKNFLARVTGLNKANITLDEGLNAGEDKLRWSTNISGMYSYANIMALPKSSDKPITGSFIPVGFSNNLDIHSEIAFTSAIDSLVLQTILYMQLPKHTDLEVISINTTSKHHAHGFSSNSSQSPIWIGLDKPQRIIKKQHLGGNHASPVTHWRRGHWRTTRKNSTTGKPWLTWIRPTIVNG